MKRKKHEACMMMNILWYTPQALTSVTDQSGVTETLWLCSNHKLSKRPKIQQMWFYCSTELQSFMCFCCQLVLLSSDQKCNQSFFILPLLYLVCKVDILFFGFVLSVSVWCEHPPL